MHRTSSAGGRTRARTPTRPRVPARRRRAGAGVGGELRRHRDPSVDVDGGEPGSAVVRARRHRPGPEDDVGRDVDAGPAVPRRDGAARPRRPAEGDRAAGHPDLDTDAAGLHLPRDVGVRRGAVADGRQVVPELVSWKWRKSDRRAGPPRLHPERDQQDPGRAVQHSPAAGAPVSVPLEWDELDDPELRPDRWTIRDVLARWPRSAIRSRRSSASEQELPDL